MANGPGGREENDFSAGVEGLYMIHGKIQLDAHIVEKFGVTCHAKVFFS